jgi:Tfp pilus assembly protein PilO
MDKEFSFATLRIIYFTYKEYLVPLGVLLFSFVLLLFIVIPQFQEYLSIHNQEVATQAKIAGLQKNIKLLSSVNQAEEEKNYQIATTALPSKKDFIGVLQAISKASINSGVSVGDFSFIVGDLSAKSLTTGDSSFRLSLTVGGGISSLEKFVEELSKVSPIAEITFIKIGDSSSSVDIIFYYKPVPQSLQIQYDQPLSFLNDSQKKLLQQLSLWQDSVK